MMGPPRRSRSWSLRCSQSAGATAPRSCRACFFFQAEDGIRDTSVTGVQTCALPIYDDWPAWPASQRGKKWEKDPNNGYREFWKILPSHSTMTHLMWDDYQNDLDAPVRWRSKIELAGMTRQGDVNALVPLAKSWEAPAPAGLDG